MMTEQEHNNVQWRKVKLGEVGEIISGGTPSTTNETFWDGDVLFVTPLDLGRKNKIDSTLRTISELGVKNSSANKIKAHSLAISTRAPIGLMSIVNQDFTTNQGCKSIQFYDSYDSEFFYYYLSYNVEKIQRYGQGTTFMEISKTDFSNLEFTVPDLSAQRRIAAILTSADKVIAATQKTIAKYKQIKQGMMEDLLKPKEGWKMVRLGEVGEIITGSTPPTTKSEYWNGEYNFYSPADFDDQVYCCKTERTVTKAGVDTGRRIPANSIMVACIASIGKIALSKSEGITNQQINTIVPNEEYDCVFLYYLLLLNATAIKNKAAQTTIPIINKEDFSSLEFYIPDFPEQRRIANMLSGVDKKIEMEQAVLDKYNLVKKGLMEKLLNEIFANHE